MKHYLGIFTIITFALTVSLTGCSESDTVNPMTSDEESAVQLTLDQTYDNVRNGAHLILNYYPDEKAFKGTVENDTNAVLQQVRVEIHLYDSATGSSTAELGPTPPKDLAPGESLDVVLPEEGPAFDRWTAHPEVGPSSSSGGGEGGGEHGGEGGGEHGGTEGEGGNEGGGN